MRQAGNAMKVSRIQAAKNRQRILECAYQLFQESGFDGVGVDAIMAKAGLTHGGFYGHFSSKDNLIEEACTKSLSKADLSWKDAPQPVAALASLYLSLEHCEDVAGGCLMPSLGSEIARQTPKVRHVFAENLKVRIADLTEVLLKKRGKRKREKAIAAWAAFVGATILARAVDSAELRDDILSSTKKAVVRMAAGDT